MPVYEYICLKCHDKFEVKKGFTLKVLPEGLNEEKKVLCLKCGSKKVVKVFSPFDFVMKI